MPVTKSAKKTLRQERKKTVKNKTMKDTLKSMLKKAAQNPSDELVQKTVSFVDKAVKQHLIHKNKAARLKSRLSKSLGKKENTKKTMPSVSKKTPKKPLRSTKK